MGVSRQFDISFTLPLALLHLIESNNLDVYDFLFVHDALY